MKACEANASVGKAWVQEEKVLREQHMSLVYTQKYATNNSYYYITNITWKVEL